MTSAPASPTEALAESVFEIAIEAENTRMTKTILYTELIPNKSTSVSMYVQVQ